MKATTLCICILVCTCMVGLQALSSHSNPQHITQGGMLAQSPPVWPETFHSILFQNRSNNLAMVDLYYDWKGGRNLNLIRSQLNAQGTMFDVEYNNGTSFYFSREAPWCKVIHFDVGILSPNWLAGATLLGTALVDNFQVQKWTKASFIDYYVDQKSQQPVKWTFLGSQAQFHVMSFMPGGELSEDLWQAPSYCFDEQAVSMAGMSISLPSYAGRLLRPL